MKTIATILLIIFFSACSKVHEEQSERDQKSSANKKNIVVVLVDDLGYSDIGAYNSNSFYKTPNIDSLANDGVLFTNGYAANPVCSPSRAAIMTGKHPTRMRATEWFHINNYPHRIERFQPGENNDFLSSNETTLAEVFKAAGYQTAFLGKWHLGDGDALWPKAQGFDINIGGASFGFPRGGYFSPYNNPNLEDGPEGEYLTDRLSDEAGALIRRYAKEAQPFLVFLSYYTVHVPLEAPEPLVAEYESKRDSLSSIDDFAPETQYWVSDQSPRRVRVRQNHPVYASMIEKMDAGVGRVLEAIEQSGASENTIVVFTSDNGGLSTSEGSPTSNLPLRGGKGWLYEGGIRVPFIVRSPGIGIAGTKRDTPIVGTDLLPTLAKLADVPLPAIAGLDGIEFGSVIEQTTTSLNDRAIFWHYPHYSNQGGFPGAAVRLGNFKLLQNFEDGSLQLYNLDNDPGESNNLVEKFPGVTEKLQKLLENWYKEVDAQFLRPIESGSGELPWRPESS